jgi:hypothetical protein
MGAAHFGAGGFAPSANFGAGNRGFATGGTVFTGRVDNRPAAGRQRIARGAFNGFYSNGYYDDCGSPYAYWYRPYGPYANNYCD